MIKKIMSVLVICSLATLVSCNNVAINGTENTEKRNNIADKVIYGKIYVGDNNKTIAEAIAINGDKIMYVGNKDGVKELVGDNTEVVELNNSSLVTAGLMDGHSHVGSFTAGLASACILPDGKTGDEYVKLIKEFVEANPEKEFYLAKGWITSAFDDKGPKKELLDDICKDKPIFALSGDGHSAWVNSFLIEKAGITKDTVDPAGGRIERNDDGTIRGCFRDTAISIVQNKLPKDGAEAKKSGILKAQQMYANIGYTGYYEAICNDNSDPLNYAVSDAYEELDKDNKLLIYTEGAFVINNVDNAVSFVDKALELKKKTKGGMYEVTGIKIFMDGIIESSSALLSEPYSNNKENYGTARWTTEEDLDKLTEVIRTANEKGLTIHFHAMGDEAVHDAIDCVEKAYDKLGQKVLDCRNAITHLALVQDEDYDRMSKLNMIAVINPWTSKDPANFVEREEKMYLGVDRMNKQYPAKSFLDHNVHISFGTDYGASFIYEPVNCYRVLHTRTTPDMNKEHVLNNGEQLTQYEVIGALTSGIAYQFFKENDFGTLEVGKIANLDVFDKDLLTIDDKDIPEVKIIKAMSYGKWIKN